MSRVGRAHRRSRVEYPSSPVRIGAPVIFRNASSSNGRAANASRSPVFEWRNVVVETRNVHRSVRILKGSQDAGQDVGRVADGPAVAARVQILIRPE